MDHELIRKLMIKAIASDETLLDLMVLKGGNALSLVHGIGSRTSLDVDYSIAEDFENVSAIEDQLFKALSALFKEQGLVLFDSALKPKPKENPVDPTWGGYQATFKLISTEKAEELQFDSNEMSRQSLPIAGPQSKREFKIDISKHEYTGAKEAADLDDTTIYVYSLDMIVAEKLRAICQQMDEYELQKTPSGRSRDFYDIHSVIDERAFDFSRSEFQAVVKSVFDAKSVPLELLGNIENYFELHAPDFEEVKATIAFGAQEFRFYFDSVLKHLKKLEALWMK